MVARVRALLRRTLAWQQAAVTGAGAELELDDERFEARWRGRKMDLRHRRPGRMDRLRAQGRGRGRRRGPRLVLDQI